jgi:hypothetical protein
LIPQEGDPQIREVRDAILPEHDNLAIEVCGTRWQLCERLGDRRKPLGPVHPLRVSIPFRIPLSSGPIAVELYFMQPRIADHSLVDKRSELRRDESRKLRSWSLADCVESVWLPVPRGRRLFRSDIRG